MRFKTAAAVLGVLLLTTGCQVARVSDPLTARLGGSDPDSQMEFWHQLAERPLASNDEAAHALLMFVDDKPSGATTYDQRIAALKEKRLLPSGFSAPADEAVKRGMLAVALCNALKIRGGLTMTVLGPNPRYATRELVDRGLFPTSSPDQTFSGTELVGIFGKAEDFQRGGAGEKTPGSLAGEAK